MVPPRERLVGVVGLEPTTYGTQNRRAARLRYTPFSLSSSHAFEFSLSYSAMNLRVASEKPSMCTHPFP